MAGEIKTFTTDSGAVTISNNTINIDLNTNPLDSNTVYAVDLSEAILKDSVGNVIPMNTLPTYVFKTD